MFLVLKDQSYESTDKEQTGRQIDRETDILGEKEGHSVQSCSQNVVLACRPGAPRVTRCLTVSDISPTFNINTITKAGHSEGKTDSSDS